MSTGHEFSPQEGGSLNTPRVTYDANESTQKGFPPLAGKVRKGKKRVRGRPVFHEEVKEPHRIMLTPTAWKKLQAIAELTNSSVSETIECWAREFNGD